jgi:5'-deoxynucleotidase YfbR-like HD superfamily hydrolase
MKLGPYLTTASGRRFYYDDPQPEAISIEDVAHSLAQTARFRGHGKVMFSVAEHSVLVMKLAELARPDDFELHRAALMHDAHEAYVGDVPTPLKNAVPGFRQMEGRIATLVRATLTPGVSGDLYDEVRKYDHVAAIVEGLHLLSPVPDWLQDQAHLATPEVRQAFGDAWVPCYPPDEFLKHARRLGLA